LVSENSTFSSKFNLFFYKKPTKDFFVVEAIWRKTVGEKTPEKKVLYGIP
jgi:hypothetical protein